MKMELTECSETSAYKIQMPGNYPEESIQLEDCASAWFYYRSISRCTVPWTWNSVCSIYFCHSCLGFWTLMSFLLSYSVNHSNPLTFYYFCFLEWFAPMLHIWEFVC